MKKPIIVHIPHSSTYIHDKYKELFVISSKDLEKEIIKMTDLYTEDLFYKRYFDRIVFPFSRLICDVERFDDPKLEEMSKVGMWIPYTKTSDGKDLKTIDDKHVEEIMSFYYKHHRRIEKRVSYHLKQYNKVLIVDAHSFPSVEQEYELYKGSKRPDICIGTDDFHTPRELIEKTKDYFESWGLEVAINEPFAGTLVPMKYYKKDKRVSSIMIEVNKKLYLNEKTGLVKRWGIREIIYYYLDLLEKNFA